MSAGDMGRVFARGIRAVVAADAVTRDIHVIEVRGNPADGRVAVVTVVAARDVGRMFAGRRVAVMAGETGAEHLGVIHHVRRPTLLWQSSHTLLVFMWFGSLPVACTPSWQSMQLAVMLTWSKFAGIHAIVVWQSSQLSPLRICEAFFPVAVRPSWQELQLPSTCVWSTV
jgi:hypothetical protein